MPRVLNERIKKVKMFLHVIFIHGKQSSNIIANLEKCLNLCNKMTNKHKCVDISLYSIQSIDTNLKSCTHACFGFVSQFGFHGNTNVATGLKLQFIDHF